ncbi:MAG: hypothetical protein AB7G21_05875 [Dehalococcoidia bacterium]
MTSGRDVLAEIERLIAGEGIVLPDAGDAAPRDLPPILDRVDAPRAARDRAVRLRAGLREMLEALVASDDDGDEMEILEALDDVTDAYLAALPRVDLARCPFTGATATLAIDTYGLDGPWWNALAVLRPVEARPATLVAVTGALQVTEPVERTRHLAKPGPGAPYVLPRLLAVEGVRAVIRAVAVGRHLGWTIAYFAERYPADAQRANDWGADHYPVGDGWDSVVEDTDAHDFDLAPWIEQGRLAWIAPGDASLTPRTTTEGCPYLDLPGVHALQRIEAGEVWTGDALPGA